MGQDGHDDELAVVLGGTNGIGGASMTLAMVESSSGAASASATNEAMASQVAGRIRIPPTIVPTSCSRNWNRVATPKLPPPPRIAQKRSGYVSASTRRSWPSAAADGDLESGLSSEPDHARHVGIVRDPYDDRRPAIDPP
jgi:hypothetical protein